MNPSPSFFPGKWGRYASIAALIYAAAVFAYIFIETAKPTGGRDFHPFWYAGHFILQGQDPYAAYLSGEQPRLPIRYVDGVTIERYPIIQGDFSAIPSNTPIMLLLLSPLSLFSWGTAKWLFLFTNLALMAATGWIVIWRLPFGAIKFARVDAVFLFLLYFDLSATRIAIENGQTTLIVFLMMMLALVYARRSWMAAGVALGVALAKYSLSLPVFVFFLYRRNFKILILAGLTQAAGLLGLSAISGSSPLTLIQENLQLFVEIFGQPGIHLSSFFERFTNDPLLTEIPVLIVTLLVFIPILLWHRPQSITSSVEEIFDLHLVTILFIWTMLIGYHRLYDTLILIVFPVLVLKGLAMPVLWNLTPRGRTMLLSFVAVLPLVFVLPSRLVDKVFPHYYGAIGDAVTTVTLLAMLSVSMFLLRQFLQSLRSDTAQRMETHGIQTDPH